MDYLRLLRGLVPPTDGSNPKLNYRWQLNIAVAQSLLILLTALGVALYLNSVPLLPGITRTDELGAALTEVYQNAEKLAKTEQQLERNQRMAQLESLSTTLDNLRTVQCAATGAALKQAYWARITALMRRYEFLSKRPYTLPTCNDLQ